MKTSARLTTSLKQCLEKIPEEKRPQFVKMTADRLKAQVKERAVD